MAADPKTAVVSLRATPLAVAPFADWTYQDAADAVDALKAEDFDVRKAYAEDEHWTAGGAPADGWVGPQAVAGSNTAAEVTAAIKRQFAPYDACGEGLSAVEDAFSTEAQVGAVPLEPVEAGQEPPEEIQRLIEEAKGLLTVLWDRVRLHEAVKPAVRASAWADRALLRWWIPPGRALRSVNADGSNGDPFLPRAEDFEQAAEWLALSQPLPDAAAMVVDEATQEVAAVYLDTITEGEQEINRAVVAYRMGENTIWRTLYEDERDAEEMELVTGGVLPIAEMRGDNLLTPSVIATQKALDYKKSTLTRIIEAGGFPERYIADAEPTGVWVKIAAGEVPTGPTKEFNGGVYQLKPQPRTLGASITTEIVGIITQQEDGKHVRASPTVTRFEPVDPTPYIAAVWADRALILYMMRQGHRAMTSSAEASGFAYEQARASFLKDLLNRKGAAEGMLRDFLTAGLAIVEALTGKPGHFTDRIRVTVDMHIDAGPRSTEERNQDRMDVEAGLLSPETAMSRGGVEDVEGEQDRISMASRLALLKEAAEVFNVIAMASSEEAAVRALIAAGVDEEIANALRRVDTDSVVTQ